MYFFFFYMVSITSSTLIKNKAGTDFSIILILHKKSCVPLVVDLEEKLHRCEADRLNCSERVQVLEEQLQTVRAELTDTLQQLQQLRDVLQRTQTIADERQASVEELTIQLR